MEKQEHTRIFEVGFFIRNLYDGKAIENEELTFDRVKVVAADAKQAIAFAENKALLSKLSYDDEETKKTVVVTQDSFDPIGVELLAEA
jgi:hypothetical protein